MFLSLNLFLFGITIEEWEIKQLEIIRNRFYFVTEEDLLLMPWLKDLPSKISQFTSLEKSKNKKMFFKEWSKKFNMWVKEETERSWLAEIRGRK